MTPLIAFAIFYLVGVVLLALRNEPVLSAVEAPIAPLEIAILGASGTAGDGILKAALASPHIGNIQIITRRITPRIQAGIDAGKVEATIHDNYLDYSAIENRLKDLDTVYWAIGISSLGVDEKTYGMIHVDFPMQFVQTWLKVSDKPEISFHFISSSDISEDSNTMWIREKIRSEKALFGVAQNTKLRVIAYRPDYIGPTSEESHLGQNLLYGFFRPVGAAVKSVEIGRAMIDLSLRLPMLEHGSKISTSKIILHGADPEER